jgi:hypothetical protein
VNKYTIRIKWSYATEFIKFDPTKTLRRGQIIRTHEYWPDEKRQVEYKATVFEHSATKFKHKIALHYDKKNNFEVAKVVDLGKSTIAIDLLKGSVTAKWKNDPSSARYDGYSPATLIGEDLLLELEYRAVVQLSKKQAKFRTLLLEQGPFCALSGERTECVLDAAHVVDAGARGGYGPGNGLLLRTDIHRLFDAGLLRIRLDGTLDISKELSAAYQHELSKYALDPKVLTRISENLSRLDQRPGH